MSLLFGALPSILTTWKSDRTPLQLKGCPLEFNHRKRRGLLLLLPQVQPPLQHSMEQWPPPNLFPGCPFVLC